MKPIDSEKFLLEKLFEASIEKNKIETQSDIKIDQLTGDASTRRYYRLVSDKSSYVICLDNPFDSVEEYPFLSVQQFLETQEIRVPKVYDFDKKNGYLLEEDLGDLTLLQHLGQASYKEQQRAYFNCIEEMIKMQKSTQDINGEHCFTKLSFDLEKYMFEVNFTNKYLLSKFFKVEDKGLIESVRDDFETICRTLAEKQKVFTHRDYHSRNVMIKNDEFVIIDFQDARMGIPQYDLVSLLEDCYFDVGDSSKKILKEYYFSELSTLVEDQGTLGEFEYLYDMMTLQRVFKAMGSFAYIYNQREDLRYIKYLGYCFEKIRIIMMKYEQLNDLSKRLSKIYYEH